MKEARKAHGAWMLVFLGIIYAGGAGAQTGSMLAVSNHSRPVLKAILDLTTTYGYVITYEDPVYVYQGDLKDRTQLRKDLKGFAPGQAPKVSIPQGGSLQLMLPGGAMSEEGMYALLQQLVGSWNSSDQGGAHFAVEEDGAVFHVVPTGVRDQSGNWQSVESIMTTPISLPAHKRTEDQTFDAICSELSASAHIKVHSIPNGGLVFGTPQTARLTLEAYDEPAESVLMRAIKMTGQKRSWYLLYDPTARAFFMNIDRVTQSGAASAAKAPSAPSTAPSPPAQAPGNPHCMTCAVAPPASPPSPQS
jgi:hypothetical protein